ncbi:hypothetical protein DPMN_025871 [Dreissena polymorpha]|uniref:Uncharacterized protein n=1 Tax=Dreissena polymorpha TaxID=45954 RepID=A0A9D4LRU3_DREPO|nr:hypothetical protein DPMN_025871 [Dreissena polymorpha]
MTASRHCVHTGKKPSDMTIYNRDTSAISDSSYEINRLLIQSGPFKECGSRPHLLFSQNGIISFWPTIKADVDTTGFPLHC